MGHKNLSGQPGTRSGHIAVRLTDADRAWVKQQAAARGVSQADILRAGLALLRAPSPDLLDGGPALPIKEGARVPGRYEFTEVGVDSGGAYRRKGSGPKVYEVRGGVGPVGSVAWARNMNLLKGGCRDCETPTGCHQEKFCDRNRHPWVPLGSDAPSVPLRATKKSPRR